MIAVIGSVNTDLVVSGQRIPSIGETVTGGTFRMVPGGKGANQAVAVARLARKPGECLFIGKVGRDTFGRDTIRRLKADGIRTQIVFDPVHPTGTALILVDRKGQNCISVAPGANAKLTPQDLDPQLRRLQRAKVLLLQLETPLETVLAAAKTASAAGTTVILNPAPARRLPRELLRLADWLTPNETELATLTGIDPATPAQIEQAVAKLKRLGAPRILVTLGAKGVWYDRQIIPAPKAKPLDTVAAGDTFNGAFAVALSEGQSPLQAIHFAQRAAAIAITRPGAQDSVPYRRELD
ncbi:MAG: ribokinase [Kiritimatiellia bacterium]|nr:ribokinase [Kiritimatiellia bacterium]